MSKKNDVVEQAIQLKQCWKCKVLTPRLYAKPIIQPPGPPELCRECVEKMYPHIRPQWAKP